MTPLQIKTFLTERNRVTLQDIAKAFAIDVALAAELIRFWISRGKCVEVKACSSCNLCHQSFYQWNHVSSCSS